MDNQSNPMGLLAPFVTLLQATIASIVATEVEKALTARAGAANAAALLDDTLDQRIRDIATSVVDGAIESHAEGSDHPDNERIRSVIDDYDFDDQFTSAIDNYDFDDKIDRALNNYDIGDKVAEVINNGTFDFST